MARRTKPQKPKEDVDPFVMDFARLLRDTGRGYYTTEQFIGICNDLIAAVRKDERSRIPEENPADG